PWSTNHDDHGDLAANEVDCQRRKTIELVLRPAIFDRHVLSLNVADFRETPPDGVYAVSISFRRSWGEESDHRHRGLRRARRNRPRGRHAADQRDEVAPLHCPSSSRAFDRKDSTARYGGRPLHCGISARPTSAAGHERPKTLRPGRRQMPASPPKRT